MQDLSKHLQEAIEINTHRMPLYAKLSDGYTLPFSKKLIRYEKIALKAAWFFDRIGDQLQNKGVPYLKAEFVDMANVPEFSNTYPTQINYKAKLIKVDVQKHRKAIKNVLQTKNTTAIVTACEQFLKELNQQTHLYCMLRHVIESLGRIAYLIPQHEKLCEPKNLKKPTAYSYFLMKLHLLMFKEAAKFDEAIAPIQNTGLPFIHQDLPHIEMRVDLESKIDLK